MSASNHHQVRAYYDAGNFIARCSTCNWTGQWRHERQNAVSDATLHLAGSIRMEDMTITTSSGMRRYSKAEYARWFEQHTCRLERDRACAAQHRDPIEPTKAEVLAGERLREYLEALEVLTYRTLHVLRRDGVPVLTSIDQDIEAALEMNQRATPLESARQHRRRSPSRTARIRVARTAAGRGMRRLQLRSHGSRHPQPRFHGSRVHESYRTPPRPRIGHIISRARERLWRRRNSTTNHGSKGQSAGC